MRATQRSSPPSHTLPLYTTIPLPIVDDERPSSRRQPLDSSQTLSPSLTLPSPPPSPPWSGALPPSFPHPVHTIPTNAVLSDSNRIHLHPILESTLFIPPRMMHEPRKPLPVDVNNHLSELVTNPGLGFLTIILLPSGRHVPVQPSAVRSGVVTLGDVLHVLEDLNVALLQERNVVCAEREAAYRVHIVDHKTQKHARQGPMRKGLWAWVVAGRPVAGYLTLGVEDVVWPRRWGRSSDGL